MFHRIRDWDKVRSARAKRRIQQISPMSSDEQPKLLEVHHPDYRTLGFGAAQAAEGVGSYRHVLTTGGAGASHQRMPAACNWEPQT